MAYTAYAAIQALIGTGVYNANDLTTAQITAFIADATDDVHNTLAEQYTVPFNGSADTPVTPRAVRLAVEYRAAALCMRQLAIKGSTDTLREEAEAWDQQAEDYIARLLANPGQMTLQNVSAETLTLTGSDRQDWEPNEYEAFIADGSANPMVEHRTNYSAPNILEDTVQIASGTTSTGYTSAELMAMRRGHEYRVQFDPQYQRYVFCADHEALRNASVLSIKYQWDYRRKVGQSTQRGQELILS